MRYRYILPVVLTALLLCSCAGNRRPVDTSGMKYHPGHYVAVEQDFDVSAIKYLDEPSIVGVNKRYRWRDLETGKGEYDFSSIESDLEYLAEHNKQLVVFLVDRSFTKKSAMPEYLSEYEMEAADGSFIPMRWNPEVKQRLIKLAEELGKKYERIPISKAWPFRSRQWE